MSAPPSWAPHPPELRELLLYSQLDSLSLLAVLGFFADRWLGVVRSAVSERGSNGTHKVPVSAACITGFHALV